MTQKRRRYHATWPSINLHLQQVRPQVGSQADHVRHTPKGMPQVQKPQLEQTETGYQESSRMMNRASTKRKPTNQNGEYTSPRRLTDGNDY